MWCRKEHDFTIGHLPVHKEYVGYAASASQSHADILRGLFPNALWVSDYWQIRRASNKAWQLHAAHNAGFATPTTLMTSSPRAASQFIDRHGEVIVKSLACIYPYASNLAAPPVFFFAKKVSSKDSIDLSGLKLAPAIFQQAINAAIDIRVNVVGDKVFAATITGSAVDKASSTVRDWRIAHFEGDIAIETYELSDKPAGMCMQLVRTMGLAFGAIDLVKDKQGNIWFLEINPNGQWAFIEEETGQPIGKAIAALLEAGKDGQLAIAAGYA